MTKIASVRTKTGMAITVYFDRKREVNPFGVYAEWTGSRSPYKYPTKHRKLLDRYGDFNSCLCYIMDKRNEDPALFNYESIA